MTDDKSNLFLLLLLLYKSHSREFRTIETFSSRLVGHYLSTMAVHNGIDRSTLQYSARSRCSRKQKAQS